MFLEIMGNPFLGMEISKILEDKYETVIHILSHLRKTSVQ